MNGTPASLLIEALRTVWTLIGAVNEELGFFDRKKLFWFSKQLDS